jgi:hypothetical protein
MANTSISGLTRSMTGSISQNVGSVSSGSVARAQTSTVAASASAGSTGGNGAGTASTANRQVVNVDGENYNRNARRGTYLNITV